MMDNHRVSHMRRREFVHAAAGALVAGGLVGCASLQTVPIQTRGGVARLRIRDYPQLEGPGGALRIQPAGLDHHLLVLAQAGGDFAVLSPICTHRGCTADVAGDRIACPCHGSEYDRTGRVLRGPAEEALSRYPADLTTDGELVIRLEAM